MPTEERHIEHCLDLVWFSTYGEPLTTTPATSVSVYRTRNWRRNFPSRRAALESLLANGYLPTTYYEDDMQCVIRSRTVRATGQLNSDPRSVFDWGFIPAYNRTAVDVNDYTMTWLTNDVLAALSQRVGGHQVSMPMTLQELPDTVQMITNAAAKLRTAYIAVKHGRFRAAAKVFGIATPKGVSRSKSFSQNWLEYRYGWRLTCFDVQGYLQQIHDMLNRTNLHRVSSRKECHGIWKGAWDQDFYLPTGQRAFTVTVNGRTEWQDEVRGGYVYEIVNEALANAEGLGLLNVPAFVWDKIGFSFIVDWFVNVGDVLQGLTAFAGKACRDGWLCKSIESSGSIYWTNVRKGEVYSLNTSGLSFAVDGIKERRFRRYPNTFTPASLRLSFGLDLKRAVDAISLLRALR